MNSHSSSNAPGTPIRWLKLVGSCSVCGGPVTTPLFPPPGVGPLVHMACEQCGARPAPPRVEMDPRSSGHRAGMLPTVDLTEAIRDLGARMDRAQATIAELCQRIKELEGRRP